MIFSQNPTAPNPLLTKAFRRLEREWTTHGAAFESRLRFLAENFHRAEAALESEGVGNFEHRIAFAFSQFTREAASLSPAEARELHIWVRRALAYPGDDRVGTAAARWLLARFTCTTGDVGAVAVEEIQTAIRADAVGGWTKTELLACLALRDAAAFGKTLATYLPPSRRARDGFFFRARLLTLATELPHVGTALRPFLADLARDPSPHVRRRVVAWLTNLTDPEAWGHLCHLATADGTPAVRATAAQRLANSPLARAFAVESAALLNDLLAVNSPDIVLQLAIAAIRVRVADGTFPPATRPALEARLSALHTDHPAPGIARAASAAREHVRAFTRPATADAAKRIAVWVRELPLGRAVRFPRPEFAALDDTQVFRLLSLAAQTTHPLDVAVGRRHWRVTRGTQFGWRFWRWLYEFRNPAAAKRQAFPHAIGRVFRGRVRIPSQVLCELAETRVPGEPLFLKDEGGWRPYLPLIDDAVSTLHPLRAAKPVTIFTPEGTTTLEAPRTWFARVRAWFRVSARAAALSRLRNWREGDVAAPNQYVLDLRALGVGVRYAPHVAGDRPDAVDPKVGRFFSLAPLPLVGDALLRGLQVFADLYANDRAQLWIFLGAITAAFLGLHLWRNVRFRRRRARLGLVIGGWGSRGKSGTERLKAALMNALGFSVFSKTTGCEAMVVIGKPFGKLQELPLFRPYEKATIWEQTHVVEIAAALESDVFLWECMALNPEYVRILQKRWMRDDLSTLTNAYPDHEDIQGPAGVNIPEVMTNFIPENRTLLTSEDWMFPILEAGAARHGSEIQQADLLEADLLTPDVLEYFPYQEHPRNIELVLTLADRLGVDRDFALREMAERVVQDIGVLKTYPTYRYQGRSFSFANGCSANERHGCISNWERLAFDREDLDSAPQNWVSVFVNNRADRVARSQVFADVMVKDLRVDAYYLVGSNLDGLTRYVRTAFGEVCKELDVFSSGQPLARLEALFTRFRIFADEVQVARRKAAMDGGVGDRGERYAEEIAKIHAGNVAQCQTAIALRTTVERAAGGTTAEKRAAIEAIREFISAAFFAKIHLVPEADQATGNGMAAFFARTTPPGLHHRMLGIQNIKGPGLIWLADLEAWIQCRRLTELAQSESPTVAEKSAQALAEGNFGSLIVCQEFLGRKTEATECAPTAATSDAGNKFTRTWRHFWTEWTSPGTEARRRHATRAIYRRMMRGKFNLEQARETLRAVMEP